MHINLSQELESPALSPTSLPEKELQDLNNFRSRLQGRQLTTNEWAAVAATIEPFKKPRIKNVRKVKDQKEAAKLEIFKKSLISKKYHGPENLIDFEDEQLSNESITFSNYKEVPLRVRIAMNHIKISLNKYEHAAVVQAFEKINFNDFSDHEITQIIMMGYHCLLALIRLDVTQDPKAIKLIKNPEEFKKGLQRSIQASKTIINNKIIAPASGERQAHFINIYSLYAYLDELCMPQELILASTNATIALAKTTNSDLSSTTSTQLESISITSTDVLTQWFRSDGETRPKRQIIAPEIFSPLFIADSKHPGEFTSTNESIDLVETNSIEEITNEQEPIERQISNQAKPKRQVIAPTIFSPSFTAASKHPGDFTLNRKKEVDLMETASIKEVSNYQQKPATKVDIQEKPKRQLIAPTIFSPSFIAASKHPGDFTVHRKKEVDLMETASIKEVLNYQQQPATKVDIQEKPKRQVIAPTIFSPSFIADGKHPGEFANINDLKLPKSKTINKKCLK